MAVRAAVERRLALCVVSSLVSHRLARIKNEAHRKREERQRAAEMKQFERQRRKEVLETQFLDWTNNKADGRVEMMLVRWFIVFVM